MKNIKYSNVEEMDESDDSEITDEDVSSDEVDNKSSLNISDVDFSFFKRKFAIHYLVISATVCLIAIFLTIYVYRSPSNLLGSRSRPILNSVLSMKNKFKAQKDSIWFEIITSLENLQRNPVSPAVFLLVSDEESSSSVSCIVETISKAANKVLPNNQGWLLVNGSKLVKAKSTDPGILIESISDNMKHSKVIVISDMEKIPALLAQGFHFLVDQYNPTIPDAVYVFTLIHQHSMRGSNPAEAVQEILNNTWINLNVDTRWPLIVRITETIIPILEEEDMGPCPLKTSSTFEISSLIS